MQPSDALVVTSFHPDHYELYGRRFLETYIEFMSTPLVVYIESIEGIPSCEHDLITFRDLTKVNGMMQVLAMTNFPAARGKLWDGDTLDFRFNVNAFCRKSFAQIDAAFSHRAAGGKALYWLDADIEFRGAMPLPSVEDTFMLYLGRENYHSCASFIGWNLTQSCWKEYFDKYWAIYMTGTVFALREWHDSFVNDFLRDVLSVPAVNLSESIKAEGACNVFDLVFSEATHKKGALKKREISGESGKPDE